MIECNSVEATSRPKRFPVEYNRFNNNRDISLTVLSSKMVAQGDDFPITRPATATLLVNWLTALLVKSRISSSSLSETGNNRFNVGPIVMNPSCATGVSLHFIQLLHCIGIGLQKRTTLTATLRVTRTIITGSTPITIGGCIPNNFPYPLCRDSHPHDQHKDSSSCLA